MPVYNVINQTIIPSSQLLGSLTGISTKGSHTINGKYGDIHFNLIGSKAKGDIVITDPTTPIKNIHEDFRQNKINSKNAMKQMTKIMKKITKENNNATGPTS